MEESFTYCPQCGETAHAHRLSVGHIVHEFVHAFTHADKGIFLIVKQLFLHPGMPALEYVEGNRKKFFNPISFLLITGGINFFLRYRLSIVPSNTAGTKLAYYATEFLHTYSTFIIVLSIPLLSLFSWIFFRSSKKNFAENLVMNIYMMGEYYLFNIITSIIPDYFFPALYVPILIFNYLLMGVYFFYTSRNFFRQKGSLVVLKVVLVEILYLLCSIIMMSISMVIYFIKSGLHVKDLMQK
jgi:hypothetical protein